MEPISQTTNSIYDFLYVDRGRVASYIAQLDPNGTLTGIKLNQSEADALSGTGRVKLFVAESDISGNKTNTEAFERQFDPAWTLPIALLNRLDELSIIHRKLIDASIGSLVLIKGSAASSMSLASRRSGLSQK